MSCIVGRIVVGVDGSAGSLQALRYAVSHARASGGLLIPVLAWTVPDGEFADRRSAFAAPSGQWRPRAERTLLTAFDEALGGLPTDLETAPLILRGPAATVLTVVANRNSDLLVIGAGRRGALRHALHASTARQCLARAQCAVVAVPPNPLARHGRAGRALAPVVPAFPRTPRRRHQRRRRGRTAPPTRPQDRVLSQTSRPTGPFAARESPTRHRTVRSFGQYRKSP